MIQGAVEFDAHSGIFTDVLRAFLTLLQQGGDDLVSAEAELAGAFFALQLLRACLLVGLKSAMNEAIGTVVGGAVWYEVAKNSVSLVTGWMQFMGSIGATVAGGGSQNAVVMDDPSRIMSTGLTAVKALYLATEGMNILTTTFMLLAMSLISLMLILIFAVLGAVTVLTTVQAYMNALFGIALVPFAIEPSTRWIAQTGLSMVMKAGVSLGSVSIIIGTGYGFLQRIVTHDPDLRFGVNMLAASLLIVIMAAAAAMNASKNAGVSAITGAVARLL